MEAPELPERQPVGHGEVEYRGVLVLYDAHRVGVEVQVRAGGMRRGPPLDLVEVLLDRVRGARLAVLEDGAPATFTSRVLSSRQTAVSASAMTV